MNAVFAAVLLAVVATCSGTAVTYGSQYVYTPSLQYAVPSTNYQYQYVQQPYVASSSYVAPVTYANTAAYVAPSTSVLGYAGYPYAYSYGYAPLLKK